MSIFEDLKSYLEESRKNCIRFDTKIRHSRIPTYVFYYNGTWILVIISKGEEDDVYRCSGEKEVKDMLKNYSWQKSDSQSVSEDIDTGKFQKIRMNDMSKQGHKQDFD
jgi:hypothetical protein